MNFNPVTLIAVDDESDLHILFKHFFRNEIKAGEVSISFASSANECLKLLNKDDSKTQANINQGRICVLTDINMPEISGIKLTETLNEKYPSIEVYLLTAYSSDHLTNISHLRVKQIVTKPIDFDELKETLNL